MSEECHSCPDCTTHFKLVSHVKENIKDHSQLEVDFKDHKKVIWEATNGKVSSSMFKWIAGFIIAFCLGVGSLQTALLTQISDLKSDIAVLQILLEKNNTSQEEVNE